MKRTVTCPRCEEMYAIDDDRIPEKGGRITCKRCGLKVLVTREKPQHKPEKEAALPDSFSFIAECPICGHRFEASPKTSVIPGDPDKKTVLLVEDEVFFSGFAKEILEKRYNVLCASTVHEAGTLLKHERVDLVLLDLVLQDCDGRELLRTMQKRCPVLIFTSRDELEMYGNFWDELQKLGADDVIFKSMNLEDELFNKLERYLS